MPERRRSGNRCFHGAVGLHGARRVADLHLRMRYAERERTSMQAAERARRPLFEQTSAAEREHPSLAGVPLAG